MSVPAPADFHRRFPSPAELPGLPFAIALWREEGGPRRYAFLAKSADGWRLQTGGQGVLDLELTWEVAADGGLGAVRTVRGPLAPVIAARSDADKTRVAFQFGSAAATNGQRYLKADDDALRDALREGTPYAVCEPVKPALQPA